MSSKVVLLFDEKTTRVKRNYIPHFSVTFVRERDTMRREGAMDSKAGEVRV